VARANHLYRLLAPPTDHLNSKFVPADTNNGSVVQYYQSPTTACCKCVVNAASPLSFFHCG
jgi:hypothetical protein